MKKLICEYCGKEKEEISFYIGASYADDPGWCMHEGTGKVSCPDCYERAVEEARAVIEKLATV